MLDVKYDENASTFEVTSPRCGTVRMTYSGRVQSFRAVSDTEFAVTDNDGTESRYSDDCFKLS